MGRKFALFKERVQLLNIVLLLCVWVIHSEVYVQMRKVCLNSGLQNDNKLRQGLHCEISTLLTFFPATSVLQPLKQYLDLWYGFMNTQIIIIYLPERVFQVDLICKPLHLWILLFWTEAACNLHWTTKWTLINVSFFRKQMFVSQQAWNK